MENIEKSKLNQLDLLKIQEHDLIARHEEMLKFREKNPDDSELRVNIDKLYDELKQVQREIEKLETVTN